MANVSWIKKAGHEILKGFEWFNSPKGQSVEHAAEAVVSLAFPPAAPVVALVGAWMDKAALIEAKAEAAASLGVTASGAQKAEAAIASVGPDVEKILMEFKLLPLSADSLKKINDAVVLIASELTPDPAANSGIVPPAVA